MNTKISAYGYIFNATLMDFDIEATVKNFCSFFDEVVLATVPSEDNTRERLSALEKLYPDKLKIIDTDIKIKGNNLFDGQLKTIAMKNCTNNILVIVDCDEKFPLDQRDKWIQLSTLLLENPQFDGVLIPVVDLYGSEEYARASGAIGLKFRIHKKTVVERGVIPQAKLGNGLIDTSKSDTTEPLLKDGRLATFVSIIDSSKLLYPITAYSNLKDSLYVLHYGFLNLQRRAKIGKEFWFERWKERSGKVENVITDESLLLTEKTIKHNLVYTI